METNDDVFEWKTVDNQGKGRLFKSELLEKLSHTNPWITLAVYIPAAAFLFWMGYMHSSQTILLLISIFIAGFLSWSLVEYLVHRFIFHISKRYPHLHELSYVLHGIHHAFPRDPSRLFMPPAPGLIIVAILTGLFYMLMGSYSFIYTSGLLIGYLGYSFLHYSIHLLRPPKLLKMLWTHHAKHHYQDQHKAFGVSTRLWDRLLGTMP